MQPVGTGEESRARFYRDRYLHGAVRRIAAHEHTGLLLRDEREQIENSFKGEDEYAGRADNFNLLTCTSTMEMGINIGDLSSTMLCSVPPSTASYLQRIGRAGRGTGSALILNMATSTNHDLHFFAEPQAMMNGEVRMPGVFLEAPEVLRRHFIAFLFDHLVRDGQITRANWPGTMQKAHKTWEEQTGPFRALVAALAEASEAWWGAFAGAFPEANTQSVADRLREHVTRRAVENTFQTVMDRYTTERSRIQGRLRALRSERDALKKVERPDQTTEERLEEVESQIKAQMSRRSYIDRRETWSILVDHGVLPNYAFPETGVTLNAQVLFPKRWNRQMENHEWVRGAGQAIKDLAPHNSFYAHRRRFDIQRVELGPPEDALCTWRFCSQCRHLARHPAETPPGACPECGASDWRDLGRLRNMHQLKVVASTMSHARSLCGDDAEERNQEHYWIEDFFSIDHTAHESAHVIESLPFGVELLGRVTLRQVNMGRSDVHGTTAPIAQKDMPEQGYRICTGCGVVEDPFGPEETRHAPWCKSRKNPGKGEAEPAPWAGAETSPERLPYLYRELDSEALRLLLPPGSLDADEDSASFQAAFGLGLRLYFGGEAGHLLVRPDERPLQQGDGTRNYLLVFDTVPGGTGYLREIARPEVLGEIFQRSLDHIRTCTCLNAPAESGAGEDPVEDQYPGGCYKCLLSYSMSRQREHIRRETAMRLLSQILENWQHLAESPDNSLQAVPETLLAESALERRFYRALQEAITGEPHHGTWKREIIGGKTAFLFTLANRSWRVLPQVTLGPARGVQTPSRADCLIEPVTPRPGTLPIAVYLDGYDPHVFGRDGSSLLGTDIEKRNAVRRSDRFLVWSISWHDLEGASLETAEMGGLWSIQQWDKLRGGWQQAIMPPLPEMFTPGFQQLLAYLRRPNAVDWQRSLARYLAFATILSGVKTTEAEAERCLNGWLVQDHRALPQPGWEQDGAWSYVQFSVSEALTCYLASRYEEVQGDLAAEDPGPLASRQHIVLRLDDRADLRADREAYELIWRRYQALENVLQFLPNCWRATTEHRDPDAAVFLTPPPATGDDSPWEAWRGHVQPEALPLFEACSAAGLPVPVFGYELLNAAEDVIGAAEMGWKQQKVAVLAPADTADRSAFEAAGWTVVVWDQADVTETLAHALGRE
jgi:DEAD/DEAH box helicase domain-containing protein